LLLLLLLLLLLSQLHNYSDTELLPDGVMAGNWTFWSVVRGHNYYTTKPLFRI